MWHNALVWLGFGAPEHDHPHGYEAHRHGAHASDHGRGHTHGVVDPVLATTARGIWAIKWSFVILGVTAVLQLGIVVLSGSVALLADTIHNVGDAATAMPLWVAFLCARRAASARFPYGLGRVEDVAGVLVVLIMVGSGHPLATPAAHHASRLGRRGRYHRVCGE
jgi:Co/Zn/Cd efflux system component